MKQLKKGDKVIFTEYYGSHKYYSVKQVDYVTKSGNYKINNIIFYPDGTERGKNEWSICSHTVEEATPEKEKQIRDRNRLINDYELIIKHCENNDFDLIQAEKIIKIIEGENK